MGCLTILKHSFRQSKYLLKKENISSEFLRLMFSVHSFYDRHSWFIKVIKLHQICFFFCTTRCIHYPHCNYLTCKTINWALLHRTEHIEELYSKVFAENSVKQFDEELCSVSLLLFVVFHCIHQRMTASRCEIIRSARTSLNRL
jgi:hypothetical protein